MTLAAPFGNGAILVRVALMTRLRELLGPFGLTRTR